MVTFQKNVQVKEKITASTVGHQITGAKIALWKNLSIDAIIVNKKGTRAKIALKKRHLMKIPKNAITVWKLGILPENVKRRRCLKKKGKILEDALIARQLAIFLETVKMKELKEKEIIMEKNATTVIKLDIFPENVKRKKWKDVMGVERLDI